MTGEIAIETLGLSHVFGTGDTQVRALQDIDVCIERGQVVVLMGPSGSGKTTLLTLVGCLRRVQKGNVRLLGQQLAGSADDVLMRMRRRVGFIFQDHHLHDSLTAVQNVRMGLQIQGKQVVRDWRRACAHVLGLLGLSDRLDFLPEELSGGQKQRVAVARAIVGNPDVIFADEPTAALDQSTGRSVVAMLRRLADVRRTSVLLVTHDHRVVDFADRIIQMEDGRVIGT